MKQFLHILFILLLPLTVYAQRVTSQSGDSYTPKGKVSKGGSGNDSGHKQIPRGITVWTVNEATGATTTEEPDTSSYLRMNRVFASGVYGEYNTLGNNGSPRLNRIFIDRDKGFGFPFVDGYSQMLIQPGKFHFTNTLSPITNLDYNECGTKITGEDHLKTTFAVNVNKQIGFGFKFDYLYSRGYYANQNLSHFNTTLWGSYHGDRYQAHLLFSTNHQKQTENGGIIDDDYIKHPEMSGSNYTESEIPTVLSYNWNVNDNHHLFFCQRYSIGFNRKVEMTEQEKEAKKFAIESQKEKAEREANNGEENVDGKKPNKSSVPAPAGRPADAKVMGDEPAKPEEDRSDRIAVNAGETTDSIQSGEKKENDEFMKNEYVPVTSFFHTAKLDHFRRLYRAYASPENYYATDFYEFDSDSIADRTRHTYLRNNLGVALLEGFNKWAKAGINLYVAHEFKYYALPLIDGSFDTFNKSSLIAGGEIVKRQGKTLHFDARGEFYFAGTDVGQVNISGNADINFPLLGDTVTLDAKASFDLVNPDTYFCRYSSRYFQWDNDLDKETRTHIEANLTYPRTETRLRFAVDNLTNYTYFSMYYDLGSGLKHIYNELSPRQESDIQIVTAQLFQNLHYGILHWDNIITFQKTSNDVVLPLPKLNVYSNLYLRFKIARVLNTDFGADVRYFTEYNAPEYSPAIQSFAIQENEQVRTTIGNYPIVNAYVNFQLKNCRFYLMMSHINCNGKGNYFLTPHHPLNGRVLRFGLNWNFFN